MDAVAVCPNSVSFSTQTKVVNGIYTTSGTTVANDSVLRMFDVDIATALWRSVSSDLSVAALMYACEVVGFVQGSSAFPWTEFVTR